MTLWLHGRLNANCQIRRLRSKMTGRITANMNDNMETLTQVSVIIKIFLEYRRKLRYMIVVFLLGQNLELGLAMLKFVPRAYTYYGLPYPNWPQPYPEFGALRPSSSSCNADEHDSFEYIKARHRLSWIPTAQAFPKSGDSIIYCFSPTRQPLELRTALSMH